MKKLSILFSLLFFLSSASVAVPELSTQTLITNKTGENLKIKKIINSGMEGLFRHTLNVGDTLKNNDFMWFRMSSSAGMIGYEILLSGKTNNKKIAVVCSFTYSLPYNAPPFLSIDKGNSLCKPDLDSSGNVTLKQIQH